MTPEALARLSRAIAEFCEPQPTWEGQHNIEGAHASNGGAWIGGFVDAIRTVEIPRPCTDSAVSMKLLGRMVRDFGWSFVSERCWLEGKPWSIPHGVREAEFWTDKRIAEAIAVAFARNNGLKWEE
jgi:hypothetical protein